MRMNEHLLWQRRCPVVVLGFVLHGGAVLVSLAFLPAPHDRGWRLGRTRGWLWRNPGLLCPRDLGRLPCFRW